MYTSTSKSVYSRPTLLSFFQHPGQLFTLHLAAQKHGSLPSHFTHSIINQIPPTVTSTALSCSLSSQLLLWFKYQLVLVQTTASSYICPHLINFLYHHHSDVIILSLLLKNLQQHIYSTNSLLRFNRLFFMFWSLPTTTISFLILLLHSDV